ncbi:MAG: hypothetical protein V4598_08195 [Bdellovibrionota bacterium]
MKVFTLFTLVSFSAFAQMPKMDAIKDMSKQVLEACKEDKSKIKGCDSYTELAPLKTCLMANKEKLSDKCKASLKLVK